jgi:hypothetical protein
LILRLKKSSSACPPGRLAVIVDRLRLFLLAFQGILFACFLGPHLSR